MALHLRKYGYIYISAGRKLTLNISQYINKNRYSTNPNVNTVAITTEEILEVLSEKVPVELTADMTHTMLSRAIRSLKSKSDYAV